MIPIPHCDIIDVHIQQDELVVCGKLSPEMVEKIYQIQPKTFKTVALTSGGGYASDAVKIVEFFNKHKKKIRVDFYCASSCANIIFMGADRLEVSQDALVLFHHTSTFAYQSYIGAHGKGNVSAVATQSAAEVSFYKSKGLDPKFLVKISSSIGPVCVTQRQPDSGEIDGVYKYTWVVPAKAQIERYRGPVIGYWPASSAEIGRNMDARGMLRPGQVVRYGMVDQTQLTGLCV